MKAGCVVLALSAAGACNASVLKRDPPKLGPDTVPGFKVVPPALYPGLFDSNGKIQAVLSNGNYTAPKSQVAEVQSETPVIFKDAKRVKIRYGPYRLPSIKEKNWQVEKMGLSGMADNYVPNLRKPCETCMISAMNADLEYADGKKADASAWLHHSVVVTAGPKIRDPICDQSNTEVIFSSGNERSYSTFSDRLNTTKAGYRVRPEDSLTLVAEFKNELEREQWVWLTVGYEFYEGALPNWKDSHVAWMSLDNKGCDPKAVNPWGPSNVTADFIPLKKQFSESTIPWKTPIDFTIMGTGGHLHDGGVSILVFQNDKQICDAKATYSNSTSGGMSGMSGMSHGHGAGEHISSISSCRLMSPAKAGDKFHLTAVYDMEKHPGSVMDNGTPDEIMGVATIIMLTESK